MNPLPCQLSRPFHLKEVFALNQLLNASPSFIAQQVYATVILYKAIRVSQVEITRKLTFPPERFSPDKLFSKLIDI